MLAPSIGGSVVLRLLRIIRLFQIMKIKPLTKGIKRIGAAVSKSKTELLLSMGVSLFLIFIGAILMFMVEVRCSLIHLDQYQEPYGGLWPH